MENKVEKFIMERIKENIKLFGDDEINVIKQNESVIKKIYLLGFINAKNCFDI